MTAEIKLGLCNPPEPIYLYVNQGEVDGESYVWYKFNISQDKKIPVTQRALTGYLSSLRLTTKEFKGKDNLKLDIVVSADEPLKPKKSLTSALVLAASPSVIRFAAVLKLWHFARLITTASRY
jgi:hypothetical protein